MPPEDREVLETPPTVSGDPEIAGFVRRLATISYTTSVDATRIFLPDSDELSESPYEPRPSAPNKSLSGSTRARHRGFWSPVVASGRCDAQHVGGSVPSGQGHRLYSTGSRAREAHWSCPAYVELRIDGATPCACPPDRRRRRAGARTPPSSRREGSPVGRSPRTDGFPGSARSSACSNE